MIAMPPPNDSRSIRGRRRRCRLRLASNSSTPAVRMPANKALGNDATHPKTSRAGSVTPSRAPLPCRCMCMRMVGRSSPRPPRNSRPSSNARPTARPGARNRPARRSAGRAGAARSGGCRRDGARCRRSTAGGRTPGTRTNAAPGWSRAAIRPMRRLACRSYSCRPIDKRERWPATRGWRAPR